MSKSMKRIKTYGIVALIVVFGIVVFQNAGAVDVRFLAWKFSMSQALLLPLVLATGFAMGSLFAARSKK